MLGVMPDRLPRQLRILYELSRVVETGPYSLAEVLERICTEVRTDFGFARVRLVREEGRRSLLDAALAERRAVVEDNRVAVPLLVEGRCLGFLVADRGGDAAGQHADPEQGKDGAPAHPARSLDETV